MTDAKHQTRSWLMQRAPLWQRLGRALPTLRRGRTTTEEALQALEGYRGLARDLATARHAMPDTNVTRALESVYASFHALIHRPVRNTPATILRMLREDIPATMSSLRPTLIWVVLLFVLSTAAGGWLVGTYPDLVSLVASEEMISGVEQGRLWTQDILNVTPSSVLSARIFTNNIMVMLFAFCAGTIYGLGTLYIVANNGLMLGAIFAFTRQHGIDDQLLAFVTSHGLVELSLICVAGAAGTTLGESLIRPRDGNRREAFQRCVRRMTPLLALCIVLMIGCGLIEGFVSPDDSFPAASRAAIGIGWFVIMVAALTGHLFGRDRARALTRAAAP